MPETATAPTKCGCELTGSRAAGLTHETSPNTQKI